MDCSEAYTERRNKIYSGIGAWLGVGDDIPELSEGTRPAQRLDPV